MFIVRCRTFAIKDSKREVCIPLSLPTDESPVRLIIKLVKVLPADQCLQLYNITFRLYVASRTAVLCAVLVLITCSNKSGKWIVVIICNFISMVPHYHVNL